MSHISRYRDYFFDNKNLIKNCVKNYKKQLKTIVLKIFVFEKIRVKNCSAYFICKKYNIEQYCVIANMPLY